MTVQYLELSDYLAIAAAVTGLDVTTLTHVTRLSLADSALHAPAAGFGGVELYPDFVDKAAVLMVRLAKNHPLPDGNTRAAWVSMRMFVEVNGWKWSSYPVIDDAEATVLASRRASSTRREPLNGFAGSWRRPNRDEWRRLGAPDIPSRWL